MSDTYIVITRKLIGDDPGVPADHGHRTVEAAVRCCCEFPSCNWYDICLMAGDLRPVVKTVGPELETNRTGEIGGIKWTWTRYNFPHPDRGLIEFSLSRGEWEQGYHVTPTKMEVEGVGMVAREIRGYGEEFVKGAAWMLSEVAKRDPTAAAALVATLNRPLEVEIEPVEDKRDGVVIVGPWGLK